MAGELSLRVLGPLEVWRDGERVRMGAAKQRALLALLVIRRGEVDRDVLVEALWGEQPPKGARNTLQVYVSKLRKALGRDVIDTTATGYRLRSGAGAVDAEQFESLFAGGQEALAAGDALVAGNELSEALALWRGPALADLRYEAFAQAEAGRLDELKLACLEERVEADLALGRHVSLVAELESLIVEQPLRERLRAQLILALYRSGRQAEALAEYQAARRMLADELGLEPSPELRELERLILGQDPKLAPPQTGPRSNLPAQPTPFIGRELELPELIDLIRTGSRRLVTLTGAGGSGKSRLGLQAAFQLRFEFEDGVWWVPLQSLADAALVRSTIASGIGTKAEPARFIKDKRMLLVLDNFEHLLDAATEVSALLASCPNLFVLVTSREPLHLAAERQYQVMPMVEPEAVALFDEHTRQVGPTEITVEICRRVDCLPLAIELAATQTKAFSSRELLLRLEKRLPLLTGGPRDAPARQRTLRATLEWSYDLLSRGEQSIFARLSVFSGGCTPEAGEEVCGSTRDDFEALADKNLLVRERGRYRMLETIRELAAERLDASGEGDAIRTEHAAYYLRLGLKARTETMNLQGLSHDEAQQWSATVELEIDNLRRAFRWFVEHGHREHALTLFGSLPMLWGRGGRNKEAERWFEDGFAASGDVSDLTRSRAMYQHGQFLVLSDRADEAEPFLDEALQGLRLRGVGMELGGEAGTRRAEALVRRGLALIAQRRGDLDRARELFEEALTDAVSDPGVTTTLLYGLGSVEIDAGNLVRARTLILEALARAREGAEFLTSMWCLQQLGDLEWLEGAPERAEAAYRESLPLADSIDWIRAIWPCLAGLAAAAVTRGDLRRAGRLWGAVEESLYAHNTGLVPDKARRYAPLLERRSETEYTVARKQGNRMSLAQAIAEALGDDSSSYVAAC